MNKVIDSKSINIGLIPLFGVYLNLYILKIYELLF